MKRLYWFTFLAVVFIIGCGDSGTNPDDEIRIVDLSAEWETASAESQNIDATQLSAAYDQAAQIDRLTSLVVVRNGYLIEEEYYEGRLPGDLHDVRSVTKSLTSSLIGIAIREGELQNTSQTIGDFLTASENHSAEKLGITIEQLLTMSSGLQWSESEYSAWRTSANQVNYMLDKPFAFSPGSQFSYNTGASHLLSEILTEATGVSTYDYAKTHLLNKLGVVLSGWDIVPTGRYNGGAGAKLNSRDIAKFGQLYLQGGKSGSEQVIPADWISRSLESLYNVPWSTDELLDVRYGYLWWMDKGRSADMFLAWGYGGQFIYGVPSLNLIIVTTTRWQGIGETGARAKESELLNLIHTSILPAMQ